MFFSFINLYFSFPNMDTEEWDKHYGSKNIMKVHEDNIYFENKLMLVKKWSV